jgi:O-antigen ligase
MAEQDRLSSTPQGPLPGWQQRFIGTGSCALLFLSMAFPTVAKLVVLKSLLLAILLAVIVLDYLAGGRSRLDRRVALWTLGLSAMGFLFAIKGMLAGNPGATSLVTVHILWPIAFTLWIAGFSTQPILSAIHRTLIVATLFIALYGCLYLLTELDIVPDIGLVSALSLDWDVQAFGAQEGYTQMAIAGMNSLPFLVPYVLASCAIQSPWAGRHRGWRILPWTACGLGCFTVIAAGRRALLLLVLLTPVLIFLVRLFQPSRERAAGRRGMIQFTAALALAVALIFGALTSIYDVDLRELSDHFATGFDLSTQTSDEHSIERRQQVMPLYQGWLDRPLFGAGLGASALGSIRSETTPWAYEMYYLALLYQTGLVGFLAYTAGIVWILWRGIKIVAEGGHLAQIMIPMLVGLCGLLIANGTNAYLIKFDAMWTLFLPLAVINYRLSAFSDINPGRDRSARSDIAFSPLSR